MKKKAKIIILTTITILWMVFIFIMSAKNATQSSSISGGFTYNILNTFFEQFRSIDKTTQNGIVEGLQFIMDKNEYAQHGDIVIEDTGYGFRVIHESMKNDQGGCGGGCSGCGH